MAIKIVGKKSTPSNKAEILEKIPAPFIDKLSVILKFDDQLGHLVYNDVYKHLNDQETFQPAHKSIWGPFRIGKRMVLEHVSAQKHFPLFQMAHTGPIATQIRLEFVPVDLGPKGMAELHSALQVFLPDGWGTVAKHAHMTRLDVTMDFPGKAHSDFLFLPKKGATTTVWRSNGTLETYQSGKPDGHHTQLYDRKAKRIALNSPWQGKEGIRLERSLKPPTKWALRPADLPSMPNPFSEMTLVRPIIDPPPGEKDYLWKLFCYAVEARGLDRALAVLPAHIRTTYRKHLEQHPVDWWDPEVSWGKWPAMLKELGIAKTNW